jgi:transcriptional regulator with XRE-family HTH domain
MKIGEKIRKIREMKGISQEYLATQMNISPQAYGKIEREETRLDFHRLEVIASLLNIDPLDIINFSEERILNSAIDIHQTEDKTTLFKRHNQHIEFIELLKEEIEHLRKNNELLIRILEKHMHGK